MDAKGLQLSCGQLNAALVRFADRRAYHKSLSRQDRELCVDDLRRLQRTCDALAAQLMRSAPGSPARRAASQAVAPRGAPGASPSPPVRELGASVNDSKFFVPLPQNAPLEREPEPSVQTVPRPTPNDKSTAGTDADAKTARTSGTQTLTSIARRYDLRVADLREHNRHLDTYCDNDALPENTRVVLRPTIPPRQRVVHDTIRSIARAQGVTPAALITENKVALGRYGLDEPLPSGLDLVIPEGESDAVLSVKGRVGSNIESPLFSRGSPGAASVTSAEESRYIRDADIATHSRPAWRGGAHHSSGVPPFKAAEWPHQSQGRSSRGLKQELETNDSSVSVGPVPQRPSPHNRPSPLRAIVTYANETLTDIATTVGWCDVSELVALNPELAPFERRGTVLPAGIKVVLPPDDIRE